MEGVESELVQVGNVTLNKINEVIRRVAEECLKVKYRRRTCQVGKKEEPPWMNQEIRNEIARRRKLNKRYRNRGDVDGELIWREYRDQKEKVRRMISEEMGKYEERTGEEVRCMGKGRQMWKMIKKLKGEKTQKREKVKLYTGEGEELEEGRYEEEVRLFWQGIYQMHGNEIERESGGLRREKSIGNCWHGQQEERKTRQRCGCQE